MKTAIAVALFIGLAVSGWSQPYLGQGGSSSQNYQGSRWPQPPGCPTEYPPKGWKSPVIFQSPVNDKSYMTPETLRAFEHRGDKGQIGCEGSKGPVGPKRPEGIPGRSKDLPHGVTYPEPTIRHDPSEVTICNEIIHLDRSDGQIASVSHEDAVKFQRWVDEGRQGPCPVQPSFVFRPETPEQEALSRLLAMISAALCIALVTSAVAALVVRHQRRKTNN